MASATSNTALVVTHEWFATLQLWYMYMYNLNQPEKVCMKKLLDEINFKKPILEAVWDFW